jgi:hypothetical protein
MHINQSASAERNEKAGILAIFQRHDYDRYHERFSTVFSGNHKAVLMSTSFGEYTCINMMSCSSRSHFDIARAINLRVTVVL